MASYEVKIESGVQLLARLLKKPDLEDFYPVMFEGGLKHGDIVDISSNLNTTDLLTDMITSALLLGKPNEEVGVLIFNTNGKFNYSKLINTLNRKISQINQIEDNSSERTLANIMSNFYVHEIYDTTQFYTSIHNLDTILSEHPNISLVLIDSLTSFYWSEQGFKITKMDLYIKNLLRMIQKVSKDYKVIFIYTRPGYFSSDKDSDDLETCELTDGVNFKVQITQDINKQCLVNVRTIKSYYKKFFNIIDNKINWQ